MLSGIICKQAAVSKGIEIVFCCGSESIIVSGSDGADGNDCNRAAYWACLSLSSFFTHLFPLRRFRVGPTWGIRRKATCFAPDSIRAFRKAFAA